MQLFNVTGIMLSYFINYGMALHSKGLSSSTWRIPFALQCIPGALLLIGMLFENESPRWLVEKNRVDDAQRALATVRGKEIDDPTVVAELKEVVDDFHGREKLSLLQQVKVCVSDGKTFYRASFAVILMFWQQWTGTNRYVAPKTNHIYWTSAARILRKTYLFLNSINYYSPQIFKAVGLQGATAGLFATGIYGVVKVVITGLGLMLATEQIGRKVSTFFP